MTREPMFGSFERCIWLAVLSVMKEKKLFARPRVARDTATLGYQGLCFVDL